MGNGLYMFRHSKRLSQGKMAEKIGCSRKTYAAIEAGEREGSLLFWFGLQAAFGVSDDEILALMRSNASNRND